MDLWAHSLIKCSTIHFSNRCETSNSHLSQNNPSHQVWVHQFSMPPRKRKPHKWEKLPSFTQNLKTTSLLALSLIKYSISTFLTNVRLLSYTCYTTEITHLTVDLNFDYVYTMSYNNCRIYNNIYSLVYLCLKTHVKDPKVTTLH